MWRRRSWFSLKGKAGIPGQTEGRPATSIGPRGPPVGSLQQRGERPCSGSTALQDAEGPVSSCCTISATWARRHPTVAPTIVDGISFVLAAYFPCRCHWLTEASLRARCFVVLRPTQGGASSLVRLLVGQTIEP